MAIDYGSNNVTTSGNINVNGVVTATSGVFSSGLGVGTSSPQQLVHISGSSASPGNLLRLQNNTSTNKTFVDFRIGVAGNYDDYFFVSRSGTDIFGITNTNRFVLPVTTNVFQSKQILSDSNGNAFIELQNSSNNTHIGYISPNNLLFSASYVEKMRLDSNGRLGIGTTSPTGTLHVIGSGIFSTNIGVATNAPTAQLHVVGSGIVGNLKINGSVISNTVSNSGIILETNGTGPLQRSSGGNSRGNYSVDLQTTRAANTQVASAIYSTIGGGQQNTCSGYGGTIGGGVGNTATTNYAVVGGGFSNDSTGVGACIGGGVNNTASARYATIAGGLGCTASAYYTFVGGGLNCTAGGLYSVVCGGRYSYAGGASSFIGGGGGYNQQNSTSADYSVIVGGKNNSISGNYPNTTIGGGYTNSVTATSATVAGGQYNLVSGSNGFIGGGDSNQVTGINGVVGGGFTNTASASYSTVPGGSAGSASKYGQLAHAAGYFTANGDAQHSIFVLRNKTSGATAGPTEMGLNGSTTYLTIDSGKILSGTINILGSKSDGATVARYLRQFTIKNVAGTTTLVSTATIGTDEVNGTAISITANNTSDYLSIQTSGVNNQTWRWVAVVDCVEMAYGA